MAASYQQLIGGEWCDAATRSTRSVINPATEEAVADLIDAARASGATVHTGGRRPPDRERGFFYQPTVVAGVSPAMPLYSEEIFGPVLPDATFDDIDQAVALANDTPYGLAAYVWTNDLRTATRVSERLHFGMIGVNEWTPQAVEAPFAGWKESGMGRECGSEGLEEYLETKLVAVGGV